MDPKRLLETRIGEHGMKFLPLLQQAKLSNPDFWDTVSNSSKQPLLFSSRERNIAQATERLAQAWRWWADSLGYFNRKVDAHNFYTEVLSALNSGFLLPVAAQWQLAGIRTVYGQTGEASNSYFLDPETWEAKPVEDTYSHPHLQPEDLVFYINLPLSLGAGDDFEQDEIGVEVAQHLTRLATVILDATLTQASYDSKETAEELYQDRRGGLFISPQYQLTAATAAWQTSGELAAIFPNEPKHSAALDDDAYLKLLDARYGFRHAEIDVKELESVPYLQVSPAPLRPAVAPVEQIPAQVRTPATSVPRPQAQQVPRVVKPRVVEQKPARVAPVQTIATTAPISQPMQQAVAPVSASVPQSTPEAAQPLVTQAAHVASAEAVVPGESMQPFVHKVTIDGKLVIFTGFTSGGAVQEIHCLVHKAPAYAQAHINTALRLFNQGLHSGLKVSDLNTELVDEEFPPAGLTDNPSIPQAKSVVDYFARWVGNA